MLVDIFKDPYRFTLVVFAYLACLAFAHRIWKEADGFLAAFWLVCMVSGIRTALGTQTFLPGGKFEMLMIDRSVLEGLYWLCLSTFTFMALRSSQLAFLCNLMVVANLCLLAFPPHWGLLVNLSMSGTFGALAVPILGLLPPKKGGILIVLTTLSLPLLHASNPIAILVAEAVAVSFYVPWKPRLLLWGTGAAFAAAGIGYMGGVGTLLHGSGRYELYADVWRFWREIGPWVLGTGTGSFYGLSLHFLQSGGRQLFPFLHSDWQQVIFEQGILGGVCAVSLFCALLWYTRRAPLLFSFWIGWGTACLSNMPMRYVPTGVLALLALKLSLAEKARVSQKPPAKADTRRA